MKTLLLSITLLLITLMTFGQVPTSERDALIALYNSTDGTNWTDNTNWNTSNPVSSWFGITVTNISGQDHVTSLDLHNNNLVGAISNGLDALTELKILILKFNSLTNQIPDDICNITTLEYLHLGGNPTLTDYVPTNIGNLTSLTYLSLWLNNFSSELPSSFTNLISLETLSIGGNQFSNEILDLSMFPNFIRINSIYDNLFEKIDIRNGNNENIDFVDFTGCPNLTCIFVDNATYSTTNWTYIDPTATFVETEVECDALLSTIDETLKNQITIYPNPTNGILNIKNISNFEVDNVTVINFLGQIINKTHNVKEINLSNLDNGIYYIKIHSIKGSLIYKVVKE